MFYFCSRSYNQTIHVVMLVFFVPFFFLPMQLTSVPGYEIDVPVLHIYWNEKVSTPSTSINLDPTVIVASNKPVDVGVQGEAKDTYSSFDIIHIRSSNAPLSIQNKIFTRSFAAPVEDRNTWMMAINSAVAAFEKAKQEHERKKKWTQGGTHNRIMATPKSPMSNKGTQQASPLVQRRARQRMPLPGQERRLEIPSVTRCASMPPLHVASF